MKSHLGDLEYGLAFFKSGSADVTVENAQGAQVNMGTRASHS